MRRSRQRATYSLEQIKALSAEGNLTVNGRSLRWIRNHLDRFDGMQVVQKVVSSIQPEDFQKSDELETIPGQWADIYRYVKTGDEDLDGEDGWYIKAFIDDSQALRLSIMSANWEGYIH